MLSIRRQTCKTLQCGSTPTVLQFLAMKSFTTVVGSRAPSARKPAGQLQYLVDQAQLLGLAPEIFHPLRLTARQVFPYVGIRFDAFNPIVLRL